MYFRLIKGDIAKSKLISLTTMLFVAVAAMLVSLAAILAANLAGAVDTLMEQAKTPHFLQMHSGEIDMQRLEAFAAQQTNVEDFQVLEFLNIDGGEISIGENTLADSVQGNGLSVQSERFDYLLDLSGNVISAAEGEIYVPISYWKSGTAQVGDRVTIHGREFTIAGLLRDSQMNSLLASSKRFLVNERDYLQLQEAGATEYLIEFRLRDVSAIGALETAYTEAGLEANGPMVTWRLFQLMNALSDGLMIAVIVLISILVVAIAFMCIRFTLLAKIEDDYREIGVMKAVGLRVSHIRGIYLAKYAAIAAAGCLLGYALSFLFRGSLTENIRLYMGESKNAHLAPLFGLLGILLIFLAIILYVGAVLRRFRRISAAEAIRFGAAQEKSAGARRLRLSKNTLLGTNIFLGVKDVLSRGRLYATMLVVLVLAAFILIVPQNLHNTISGRGFIRYMGIGDCDLRIDIQQTDDIAGKAAEIAAAMEADSAISRHTVLTTKTFRLRTVDGAEERITVELGDHAAFPVEYTHGGAPGAEDEIALSTINADELGKQVGDTVALLVGGSERQLTVCGVYSDVTNGGKTAKAVFADDEAGIMWSIVCAAIPDRGLVDDRVAEYAVRFPFAKVSDIDEFIAQMYGATIASVGLAARVAIVASLLITVLVTLLFMRMLLAKDRYSIAVMKAFGYTGGDITVQYVARAVFVLVVGVILGTLLANTLGESIAGLAVSSVGASLFRFTVNPLTAYLLCPLMMAAAVLVATMLGTSGIGRVQISENIKE